MSLTRRSLDVGDGVTLDVAEVGGDRPGPVVALLGGVHGDEPEGVLAVRRVVSRLRHASLAGRLRALAVSNPPAHAADRREGPLDGLNLARVFPGRPDGTVTERIARAITDEVIAGSDLVIDLHSAGAHHAMPLFCGFARTGVADAAAEAAARAFAAPLTWVHDALNPGRTLSAAAALGVPALYAEASGGGEVRGSELDRFTGGVLRVLAALGLGVSPPPRPAGPQLVIRGGDGDVDRSSAALADGAFVTRVHAGQIVAAADTIGEVFGDDGELVETVLAPRAGIVALLRRTARISAGDGVALIAPEPVPW